MNKTILSLFLALPLSGFFHTTLAAVEQKKSDCDPVVHLGAQVTTLQQALTVLAKNYGFDLTFATDADRSIEPITAMTLSKSLKYLTAEVNTVLQYEKTKVCPQPRLVSMEVLPVGEDTEYVYITPSVKSRNAALNTQNGRQGQLQGRPPEKPIPKPVDIENMDLYVEQVLLKTRDFDRGLTREQRIAFGEVMKRTRPRLEAAGLLEPRRQRSIEEITRQLNGNRIPE